MATDASESDGSLKQPGPSSTVINKSSGESDTPRISAQLENKSSRVAQQGSDEKAVTEDCTRTGAMASADNAEPDLSSPSKTKGVQEESAHKVPSEESILPHSSSPVKLPHAHAAMEHNGR